MEVTQLFTDSSKDAVINRRIMQEMLSFVKLTNLTQAEQSKSWECIQTVAQKLSMVIVSVQAFEQEEQALIKRGMEKPETLPHIYIKPSQGLQTHFDNFLNQYKSALDTANQLPKISFGRKRWDPFTFGDNGTAVLNAFKNLPNPLKEQAPIFEKRLTTILLPVLPIIKKLRDDSTHGRKIIPLKHFTVLVEEKDSNISIFRPKLEERLMIDFLYDAWQRLWLFTEFYLGFTLTFKLDTILKAEYEPFASSHVSGWSLTSTINAKFEGPTEVFDLNQFLQAKFPPSKALDHLAMLQMIKNQSVAASEM